MKKADERKVWRRAGKGQRRLERTTTEGCVPPDELTGGTRAVAHQVDYPAYKDERVVRNCLALCKLALKAAWWEDTQRGGAGDGGAKDRM